MASENLPIKKAEALHPRRIGSLRAFVFFLAALSFLIAAGIYSSARHRSSTMELARIKSQTQAQILAENAASLLQSIDMTLLSVLSEVRREFSITQIFPFWLDDSIQKRILFLPQVENVIFLDEAGDPIYLLDSRYDFGEGGVGYGKLVEMHRDAMVEFHVNSNDYKNKAEDRIHFSRRFEDIGGKFRGVLIGVINPAFFHDRYRDYETGGIDVITLYNEEEKILASWSAGRQEHKTPAPKNLRQLRNFGTFPEETFAAGGLNTLENKETIISFSQLNDFPFRVGVAYDKDAVLGAWRRETRNIFGSLAFIGVAGLFLLILLERQSRRRRLAEVVMLQSRARSELTQMMREVAVATNDADNVEDAVKVCLGKICAYIRWPAGLACLLGEEHADSPPHRLIQHLGDATRLKEMKRVCSAVSPEALAYVTEPAWVRDIARPPEPLSTCFEGAGGFSSGCLVPVVEQGRVLAVIMFFTENDAEADETLLEVISQAASLLGRVVERKRIEQAMRKNEQFLRNIFDTIQDGICILDPERNIIRANSAMERMYSHRLPIVGKQCHDVYHMGNRLCEPCFSACPMSGEDSCHESVRQIAPEEETGWMEIYSFPMLDENRKIRGVVEYVRDITERKHLEEQLKKMATTDSLTGAKNRRCFMEKSDEELRRSARHDRPLSVLMMDIDHFKRVNDSFGHSVGDDVLKSFVMACDALIRETDILGRLGGEEFAVVLGETPLEEAAVVAERLRLSLSELSVPAGEEKIRFTVSIGLTAMQPGESSLEEILNRADTALYAAKNGGRNRVVQG